MQPQPSIVKHLVLIGGGHSHAIALRLFGMQPLPGVRLTLITEASDTPYSGMVPGHVAGFYTREECYIDLRPLCRFAGADLDLDRVIGLDLEHNRVICAHRPPVAFDWVSIDIGSTPKMPFIPGTSEADIPAKPIREFLERWHQVIERVRQNPDRPFSLGIVGGGTGGVELALNMQRQLHQILNQAGQPPDRLTLHLLHKDRELMPTHNGWVRRRMQQLLAKRGVQLHLGETVQSVEPGTVHCASGLTLACDRVVWVTQASAPDWVAESGLATDPEGFIQVTDTLQSCSHPQVFAAGDIATMVNHPRPKAGVFAVRQGKPLFENLQRALRGQPLQPFRPQQQYLSLIGTGDRLAVASRGPLGWQSPLLWNWKDWIDRRFMERFRHLPAMIPTSHSSDALPPAMPCAGCGSKVGGPILAKVLQRLRREFPAMTAEGVLVGLDSPDDAAVLRLPADRLLVQTVDYFRSPLNDPFLFGQISAHHCLSDLFAMGARPHSALAIVTIPYGLPTQQEELLYQLLSGVLKGLGQAGATLIGGHTTEGPELACGLTCNGLVLPDRLLQKSGMVAGQVVILTKAIGTGTLLAADMQRQVRGCWIDGAIQSMLRSNQAAVDCLLHHGVTACTDVTGFGLLGHLAEMVQASDVAVILQQSAIPILEGARETTRQGILSSLQPQNQQVSHHIQDLASVQSHPDFPLLFDPQTSGGLLASVPADRASACLEALHAAGYPHAAVIGRVEASSKDRRRITIE